MNSALASLVAGVLLYSVFVWRQTRAERLSTDTWRDYLGIGTVASLALLGLLFWVAFGLGPGATGESTIEYLFTPRRWRNIWMPYAGFAAVAFTTCAALHVAFLKVVPRNSAGVDA
jgi:hypothetical protein